MLDIHEMMQTRRKYLGHNVTCMSSWRLTKIQRHGCFHLIKKMNAWKSGYMKTNWYWGGPCPITMWMIKWQVKPQAQAYSSPVRLCFQFPRSKSLSTQQRLSSGPSFTWKTSCKGTRSHGSGWFDPARNGTHVGIPSWPVKGHGWAWARDLPEAVPHDRFGACQCLNCCSGIHLQDGRYLWKSWIFLAYGTEYGTSSPACVCSCLQS